MGERLPLLSEGSLESETCVHPNVPFSSLPLRAQARHLSPCIPLGTPPPPLHVSHHPQLAVGSIPAAHH